MAQAEKIGRNMPCPCGSGKKYKKCHLGSDVSHRTKPIIHEKLAPLTFSQFASTIETLPHHPLCIATTMTQYCRENIGQLDASTKAGFHVRDAGATFLASFYRDRVEAYDNAKVPVGDAREAQGLVDFVLKRLGSRTGKRPSDGRLTALQVLCNQSSIFGQTAFLAFRTLFLLELEDVEESHVESSLDYLFQAEHGCSTRQYLSLFWGMWVSAAIAGDYLDGAGLVANSDARAELEPVAKRILASQSCSTQDVKHIIDTDLAGLDIEGMVPAFFARHPFLEFKPGTYIPAPHPYIKMAAITGCWFEALRLARKDADANGSNRPETPAANRAMGTRFEKLTGWLLGKIETGDLVDEHIYTRSGDSKSPDFLLFEAEGHQVTLVQAKLKRLGPHAFFGFNFEAFEADAGGPLSEMISRTICYLYRIHSEEWAGKLSPQGEAIARRVRNAKQIFLLGVSSALPPVFHINLFREVLERGVANKLRERERVWFEANKSRIAGWHVTDSEEIAEFVSWRDKEGLHSSLVDYVNLPGFGRWIDADRNLLSSFSGDFAAKARRLGRQPSFPEVDKAVHRFSSWAIDYFRMRGAETK